MQRKKRKVQFTNLPREFSSDTSKGTINVFQLFATIHSNYTTKGINSLTHTQIKHKVHIYFTSWKQVDVVLLLKICRHAALPGLSKLVLH